MKWMRLVWVLLICSFALTALTAFAQEPSKGTMDAVRDSLKAQKRVFVGVNMQLTEAEDAKFWPVYDSYQKDLIKLNDRALKNISDYASNMDKMTDDVAKKVLKEHLAIESDRQKLRQSYLPKFEKVLPYKKVMRYYQLENKILAVVMYEAAKQIPLAE